MSAAHVLVDAECDWLRSEALLAPHGDLQRERGHRCHQIDHGPSKGGQRAMSRRPHARHIFAGWAESGRFQHFANKRCPTGQLSQWEKLQTEDNYMETVKSNLTKHEFFISGPNKRHYQCFIGYSATISKCTNDNSMIFCH